MEEGVVARLQGNIASMEDTRQQYQLQINKHQENLNRNVLDIDELTKNRKDLSESVIEIDKENSRLVVRVDRSKIYEISYSKRDDKFMINSNDKMLIQAIAEFNFHRDLSKLYTSLLKFS
jgi:uncharacterized protein YoxC